MNLATPACRGTRAPPGTRGARARGDSCRPWAGWGEWGEGTSPRRSSKVSERASKQKLRNHCDNSLLRLRSSGPSGRQGQPRFTRPRRETGSPGAARAGREERGGRKEGKEGAKVEKYFFKARKLSNFRSLYLRCAGAPPAPLRRPGREGRRESPDYRESQG